MSRSAETIAWTSRPGIETRPADCPGRRCPPGSVAVGRQPRWPCSSAPSTATRETAVTERFSQSCLPSARGPHACTLQVADDELQIAVAGQIGELDVGDPPGASLLAPSGGKLHSRFQSSSYTWTRGCIRPETA